MEVLVVAKKKSKQSKKVFVKGVPRNVIVGGIVVVLVVVLYYLFASQNGSFVGLGGDDGETYLPSQDSMVETLPEVVGQSYFGFMKAGYVVNVLVGSNTQRIEFKTLNDDGTVDIVLNRAYNLEEGETVFADYDYDGVADLAVTLEGVDMYENRFSVTITYFTTAPDEIVQE